MQLSLVYLEAAAIEEVPIDAWREVFEATGWPASLAGKRDSFGHEDVLRAFETDNPTDELLEALETLHALGTESGRDAVVSAMNDRHVPLDVLPTGTGAREFALRFYVAQRNDASLTDVYARAQTQVQEGSNQRRYNEFMGKEARSVTNPQERKDALREEVLAHCRESDLGDHVEVRTYEENGTCVFRIVRSDRKRNPLAVLPGRTARATLEFRPVQTDILRYESSIGRLRIIARAASMVEFYRATLGKVLFRDEFFFDGEPVCSLKVLQVRGRAALEDHRVFPVGRVRMTECLWEHGDGNLFHIRSNDCFRSIEKLGLPLIEGEILQAKLKLEVIGKSTRPVTVNIRVPSRIEVSQKLHEGLVEKVLNAVGIRNAPRTTQVIDLWSLYPWRHPVRVWRTLLGAEMDVLVQGGVLGTVQLDSVPHPEHTAAGLVLAAHAVSDNAFYGVSDVAEIPSRSLSPTDLDGLELVPEKLRLYLRSRLGISTGGAVWDGRQEVLDLGVIELAELRFYLVYALRQAAPGIGDRIRTRAGGAHPVLLVPSSQTDSTELAKVMLDSALPTQNQVVRGAITAYQLSDTVPAIYIALDEARLVVDTRLRRVWVDRVEIGGLPGDTQPFRLIELLARAQGAPVSTDDISAQLSPARMDGNTTARQAKIAARRHIVEAMTAAGRSFNEDPFPTAGTGFYRCALPSYVR